MNENKVIILSEEDTKRKYITPIIEKKWDSDSIYMEYPISEKDGNKNNHPKIADYVLFYNTYPLAVVEAKKYDKEAMDGFQQAKNYAKNLKTRFAISTNGKEMIWYDMIKGNIEDKTNINDFPSKQELFNRTFKEPISNFPNLKKLLDTHNFFSEDKKPRYYQMVAINKTLEAIGKGKDKILLVLATGTGKTYVAFQIIWRLLQAGLKKRILYLADRNILIDQTMSGDFKPFNKKMTKIKRKKIDRSYEIYLSLYQQLSENNNDENDILNFIKDAFKPDFFDLIIIDECHRGSARDESNWRKILDYFSSATKIGMTATPKETKNVSNSDYFGNPIYTYSLKDGIEDGFLAPFKIYKYNINIDIDGYLPENEKKDIYGDPIEIKKYEKNDFDKQIIIDERTKIVAKNITEFLEKTDKMAKTIVFCRDIEHAQRMTLELIKQNAKECAKDDRYIMQITGDQEEGKLQLDNFTDNESKYPTIVVTSKLLTTGVDCPTCKNIVIDNEFGDNGMIEFKQIIGRGTRICKEYNKYEFNILDFRNATEKFKDPEFDGPITNIFDPTSIKKPIINKPTPIKKKKIHVNNVDVTITSEIVEYYEDGKLIKENFIDFTKKNVLNTFPTLEDFLRKWTSEDKKETIIKELEKYGIIIENLKKIYHNKEYDEFDLICNIAYGINPITKKERSKRKKVQDFLNMYSGDCRKILDTLISKYSNNELDDIKNKQIFKLKDFLNIYGSLSKIINLFGGKEKYNSTISSLQKALYID